MGMNKKFMQSKASRFIKKIKNIYLSLLAYKASLVVIHPFIDCAPIVNSIQKKVNMLNSKNGIIYTAF